MMAARPWQANRRPVACCRAAGRRAIRRACLNLNALLFLLLMAIPLTATRAVAHDASAYGGVFRSRSMGNAWLNADTGLFLNAALIVAVDPANANHLLMGSDTGLLSSVNGGRSWTFVAPTLISGAVFAVAFSPDGATALCATPGGIFRAVDGTWHRSDAPTGATPARGIVFGTAPGQVYLLGQDRLFSSNDGGARFVRSQDDADDGAGLETLAIVRQSPETLFAVAQGRLLVSTDHGRHWQRRAVSDAAKPVEIVVADPTTKNRIWVAGANRLHVSSDGGQHWQPVGNRLPEARTVVRGIAADSQATTLVVTTHRGTYRSTDGGMNWALEEDTLPVHLEAGSLTRDPRDPGILYVVYSLIPYPEVWRSALGGGNLLTRADPLSLIGGLAFLGLLLLGGIILIVWLSRWRRSNLGAIR